MSGWATGFPGHPDAGKKKPQLPTDAAEDAADDEDAS
jgi:hypothetical protein